MAQENQRAKAEAEVGSARDAAATVAAAKGSARNRPSPDAAE